MGASSHEAVGMELDEMHELLLAQRGATDDMPFGPDTAVYRVGGKMFALIGLERMPRQVNLKCDPERTVELRERYPDGVLPGYHMSKKHWNSVLLDGTVPRAVVIELVEHSWQLVFGSLTGAARAEIE